MNEEDITETNRSQEQWTLIIEEYREAKRNAKSRMTRVLNKLAGVLSRDPGPIVINELLQQIEEQMEDSLKVMSQL